MRLTRLKVTRLPGINRPFSLEPAPGVNVITGPNGSGKSSVTRAVLRLLWPDLLPTQPFEVAARFRAGETGWRASGDSTGKVAWVRESGEEGLPRLPSVEIAPSYRLGFLDVNLPGPGEDDRQLAAQLRRQMDGGFDLSRILNEVFPPMPQAGQRELRALREATARVRALRNRYELLAGKEREIDTLDRQVQDARLARRRVEALEKLLTRSQVESALESQRSRLAAFAPGHPTFLPEDADHLPGLCARRVQSQQSLARSEKDIAAATLVRDQMSWPEGFDPDEVAARLDIGIDRAEKMDRDLAALQRDRAGEESVLRTASGPEAASSGFDARSLRQLLALHAEWQAAEARAQAARLAQQHAADLPSGWSWSSLILMVAGLAGWVTGEWVLASDHPLGSPLRLAAGAVSLLGGFLLGRRWIAGRSQYQHAREQERKQAETETVKARQRRDELAKELTADLDLDPHHPDLFHDLKAAFEARDARLAATRLEGKIAESERQLDAVWEEMNRLLEPLAIPPVTDLTSAKAASRELNSRRTRWQEATHELEKAESRHQALAGELASQQAQIERIAARLQLDPEEDLEDQVGRLASSHAAWVEASEKHQSLAGQREALDSQLREIQQDTDLQILLDESPARWRERLTEDQQLAQHEQEWLEQWTQLRTDVANARQADDLEATMAHQESCRQALEAKREQVLTSELGQMLLRNVRTQSENQSRPPVLTEAQRLFRRFTGGRHQLLVRYDENGQGLFSALDTDQDQERSLEQLSDGARAQLMLAIRLGFILHSEGSLHPPLFLDDSLAASDPERFATIAVSLGRLALDQGRQVFFLTADPAEVAAWNRALQQDGLEPANIIDLAELRQGMSAAPIAEVAVPRPAPIPPPANRSPAEYARALSVPRLDPWEAPTSTHLFYLLPDQLELLAELLRAGLPTVGRWKQRPEMDAGVSARQRGLIEGRVVLWERVVEAWRVGRARPLDMAVIDDSGVVTAIMRPKVAAVLQDCAGNARSFLAALHEGAVNRFKTDKKNQLQEFLELEGFLPSREPFDEDALVQQVRSQISGHPQLDGLALSEIRQLVQMMARFLDRHEPARVQEEKDQSPF